MPHLGVFDCIWSDVDQSCSEFDHLWPKSAGQRLGHALGMSGSPTLLWTPKGGVGKNEPAIRKVGRPKFVRNRPPATRIWTNLGETGTIRRRGAESKRQMVQTASRPPPSLVRPVPAELWAIPASDFRPVLSDRLDPPSREPPQSWPPKRSQICLANSNEARRRTISLEHRPTGRIQAKFEPFLANSGRI